MRRTLISKLIIRGDDAAFVLLALLGPACSLAVVDIGTGDRLDEFFLAQNPLEVLYRDFVAAMRTGFVRRMHTDRRQEYLDGVCDRSRGDFFRLPDVYAGGDKLTGSRLQ